MSPEAIQATMQFMNRVQLNAQEIPAWQQCMQELQELANPIQKAAEPQLAEVTPGG
jgi:hypothetical protein